MANAFICDGCGKTMTGTPVAQELTRTIYIRGHNATRNIDLGIRRSHSWPPVGPDPFPDLCKTCWQAIARAAVAGDTSITLEEATHDD